jgi:hypothetical protein
MGISAGVAWFLSGLLAHSVEAEPVALPSPREARVQGAERPLVPSTASPTAPIAVAVLDLRATDDVKGAAKALATLITAEVASHPGHKALSRGELASIIAQQADAQLLGCDQPACMADIGTLVAADRVVAGSLERVESGALVLSLLLVDPKGPTVLERVAFSWNAPADDLVDLARPAVDRLLLGKRALELKGALEVVVMAGAEVAVDDKALGEAPVKPVRDLPIGVHRVSVRKPGFVPVDRDVAITADETTVARVDLVDELSLQPWYARWYVWGTAIAAVAVVGGSIGAVAAWQYFQTPAKLVVGTQE